MTRSPGNRKPGFFGRDVAPHGRSVGAVGSRVGSSPSGVVLIDETKEPLF